MAHNPSKLPILTQYNEMKRKHPDAILLFRVGDFYETFADDAVACSEILGITLTTRANGATDRIHLAGFPHHALDTYLPKLVRAGKRVAICEQIESPLIQRKMRSKTAVTEVATPAKTAAPTSVPIAKAVEAVKTAAAPVCRQLTLDFDF